MRATLRKLFFHLCPVGACSLILAGFWSVPPASGQVRTDADAAQVRAEPSRAATKEDSNIRECRIKGDVSLSGDFIFYLPSHPSYKEIKIIRYNGGTMFCTEAAARAAGWKPAP